MKRKTDKQPKEKVPFKQKLKNGWKWTRQNLLNKETLFFTIIGEALFWSPVIVCAILGWIVDKRYWAVAGSIAAFWTAPLTPGWAIQIGLIFGLKKLLLKPFRRMKKNRAERKEQKQEESAQQSTEQTEQAQQQETQDK